MSYEFGMYLAHCPGGVSEAYTKAIRYAKEMEKKENAQAVLENNTPYYVPSVRYRLFRNESQYIGRALNEYWIASALTLRFVWWSKFNLLGLVGTSWPKAEDAFPSFIYFQDGTDSDISEEEWKNVCPAFGSIVDETKKDFLKKSADIEAGLDEDEDFIPLLEDHLYDAIVCKEALDIDAFLYRKETEAFETFALSTAYTMEMQMELNRWLTCKLMAAEPSYGEKELLVAVEHPTVSNETVVSFYTFRVSRKAEKFPTGEDFLKAAHAAVEEYLKTEDGRRLAATLETCEFSRIFPALPRAVLSRYDIQTKESREMTYVKI